MMNLQFTKTVLVGALSFVVATCFFNARALAQSDCVPNVRADYNDDGIVNFGDYLLVLVGWGETDPPAGWVNDLPNGEIGMEELLAVLGYWDLTPTICGDFNGDCSVDFEDQLLMLANWGQPGTPVPEGWIMNLPNGIVDFEEYLILLTYWGNTCDE